MPCPVATDFTSISDQVDQPDNDEQKLGRMGGKLICLTIFSPFNFLFYLFFFILLKLIKKPQMAADIFRLCSIDLFLILHRRRYVQLLNWFHAL